MGHRAKASHCLILAAGLQAKGSCCGPIFNAANDAVEQALSKRRHAAPLILAAYEVAFVQSASCPAGKVLKVTGAIRGLDRRKVCVSRGRLCNELPGNEARLTDCAWRCEAMVLECVGLK